MGAPVAQGLLTPDRPFSAMFVTSEKGWTGSASGHRAPTALHTQTNTYTHPQSAQSLPGATAPLGFFDPLGLSATVSFGRVLTWREAELKHGRVAMLAALGFPLAEAFHPLFGGQIDAPSLLAFQQTPLQQWWPVLVAAVAVLEIRGAQSSTPLAPPLFPSPPWDRSPVEEDLPRGIDPKEMKVPRTFKPPLVPTEFWQLREGHVPGDLGFDPLGWKPDDPERLEDLQAKELNHGRLAMIAIAGMVLQEWATAAHLFPTVATGAGLSLAGFWPPVISELLAGAHPPLAMLPFSSVKTCSEVPMASGSAQPPPSAMMAQTGKKGHRAKEGIPASRGVQDLPGAIAPLGLFDPLHLATSVPFVDVRTWREAEIKHGRVAMLAALGFPLAEVLRPLFGGQAHALSVHALQHADRSWAALVLVIAVLEIPSVISFQQPFSRETLFRVEENHASGDFGFDPLRLKPADPAGYEDMQNKELAHGRLAMIAIAGMVAQELMTHESLFPLVTPGAAMLPVSGSKATASAACTLEYPQHP